MKYMVSYCSERGKGKQACEDSALIGHLVIHDEAGTAELQRPCWICICDGVGGNAGGQEEEQSIIVSLHDIAMSNELNVEDLFALETIWQEQEPWKSEIEAMGGRKPFSKYNSPQKHDVIEEEIEEEIEEYHQSIMDIAEARRLHAEAKRRLEHEDYWKSLLECYEDLEQRLQKK